MGKNITLTCTLINLSRDHAWATNAIDVPMHILKHLSPSKSRKLIVLNLQEKQMMKTLLHCKVCPFYTWCTCTYTYTKGGELVSQHCFCLFNEILQITLIVLIIFYFSEIKAFISKSFIFYLWKQNIRIFLSDWFVHWIFEKSLFTCFSLSQKSLPNVQEGSIFY